MRWDSLPCPIYCLGVWRYLVSHNHWVHNLAHHPSVHSTTTAQNVRGRIETERTVCSSQGCGDAENYLVIASIPNKCLPSRPLRSLPTMCETHTSIQACLGLCSSSALCHVGLTSTKRGHLSVLPRRLPSSSNILT